MSLEASPLNVEEIREDFPVLDREVEGEPLVYLDNAATSLTPEPVIDTVAEYYREFNANVHRGMHSMSQEASQEYERAHDVVAEFLGASGREEVVFTGNTTEAVNTVAFGWGMENVDEDDNVVLTQMEHHSSLVPWQQVAQRTGAELRFIEVDDGVVTEQAVDEAIDEDTAAVSVVHVSNVYGTVTPVESIVERAHEVGAKVLVDGAQSAPNVPVDVEELGCDFFAFSGHKALGPTGTGALYGRRELLEEMQPFEYGGEMISKVEYDSATWADLPWKFEAGTQNVAGSIGLARALEYLEDLGLENVHEHECELTRYALEQLEDDPDVEVYGPPAGHDERCGVISFNVADAHSHDTSDLLNSEGVATRSGHHCAQPLMDLMGVPSTSRASFYLYNTREEADRFVEALDVVKEVFA